jgi:hypothetical protein
MTADDWDHFDWASLLRPDGRALAAGASVEVIAAGSLKAFRRIAGYEVEEVRRFSLNPWTRGTPEYDAWLPTDASSWVFPRGPFPPSYLSLVRWANGGPFLAGVDRILQIIPVDGIRQKMIELHSPKRMALAVPFAWNDVYDIYCFDMRQPLRVEYPILVTRGNAMDYAVSSNGADGLVEFLRLPDNPRPP